MYSPNLGKFISKDPKGYIDGMNLYAYVKNNPLKYLDAFGTTAVQRFDGGYVSYSISGRTDDYSVNYDNGGGFGKNESTIYSYQSDGGYRMKENNDYSGNINGKDYSFTIDSNDQNRLTAQTGYRPLNPLGINIPIIGNSTDETLNTMIAHEQITYSDGTNEGFFGNNKVRQDEGHTNSEYTLKETIYEGNAMQQAVEVTKIGTYDLIDNPLDNTDVQNNCQDFIDRCVNNYNQIINVY